MGFEDRPQANYEKKEKQVAFESNIVTFIGNLVEDPTLRFTPAGVPVASLRLASNRRWKDRNGQEQEDTTFMSVNAWRDLAEHAAESVGKGDRVVVIGRLRVRTYEKDGRTVWVTEIEADEIAPSLKWATASVTRSRGTGARPQQQAAAAPSAPSEYDVAEAEEAFGGESPMF